MTQHPDIQRLRFRDVSTSYAFLAATDYTTAVAKITSRGAKFQIVVQKITLAVTTDHAAVQTFQSSNATPVEFAKSKASPGLGPITWDFGPEGYVLAAGENLMHKMSAAGMAGTVTITAYERPDPSQSLQPNIAGTAGNSF